MTNNSLPPQSQQKYHHGFACKRLDLTRKLLMQLIGLAKTDIGFQLWDGSFCPDRVVKGPVLGLHDENIIAHIVKKPQIETLTELYLQGRIDLIQGTPKDVMQIEWRVKSRDLWRQINKKDLALLVLFALPLPKQKDKKTHAHVKQISTDPDQAPIDFFTLFLGENHLTSSARFASQSHSLEIGEIEQMQHICAMLGLEKNMRLLDIGCGWGAMLRYCVNHIEANVTGITPSEHQYLYNRQKLTSMATSRHTHMQWSPLTKIPGSADCAVMLGTLEQIKLEERRDFLKNLSMHLPERAPLYIETLTRRAKYNTIHGKKPSRPRSEYRNFQRYVLGQDGSLQSLAKTLQMLESVGFDIEHVDNRRFDYATTIDHWSRRLNAAKNRALTLGGGPNLRLWQAYLAGVHRALERKTMGCFHIVAKKRSRGFAVKR
jgi:cyclopropane-fatty-acyl-phospholipid synthase